MSLPPMAIRREVRGSMGGRFLLPPAAPSGGYWRYCFSLIRSGQELLRPKTPCANRVHRRLFCKFQWLAPEPFNTMYTGRGGLPEHRAATVAEEASRHPWMAARLEQAALVAPTDDRHMEVLRSQYYAAVSGSDPTNAQFRADRVQPANDYVHCRSLRPTTSLENCLIG